MNILPILLILFLGCFEIDDQIKENRIIWESTLNQDIDSGNKITPLFFNDNVIVSRFDFYRKQSALICFDKKTGIKNWEWSDSFVNRTGKIMKVEISKALIYNDLIIGLEYNKMYGINAETGKTIWKTVFDDQISDRFYLFEDRIYCMSQDYFKHNKLIYYVLDPNTGSYNTLYELPGYEEGYNILSGPFRIFNNKEGENCLLIGIAHVKDNYKPTETWKYGMMCYNLDKKEIIFKQSYSFEVGLSNLYIHYDKIYSTGSHFSEYELSTGKLIKQFKQDQSTIDLTTLYDYPYAYLMYNNTTNRLVKVNMITGKEIGRLSLDGRQAYNIAERKGNLYVHAQSGKIFVIDKNNFKIIEKITAPHYHEDSYLSFDEEFTFDEETGYMYCTDFKHLICYDLDK